MSDQKEFVSVGEVARRFSVTTKTVYRWIEAGRLRAIKPGPTAQKKPGRYEWRISESAISEFVASSMTSDGSSKAEAKTA